MTLRLVHSRADLPPRWDGQPVVWGVWHDAPASSWSFHAPLDERACTACGVLDGAKRFNVGVIGKIWRLHVARCECRHDVVYDHETGEVWDLDESDYGPDGSRVEGSLW